jgi:hypothetical protein
MTDQDVRDYLNRQQQQDRMRQQVEFLLPSQEDLDHDAAQAVERHVTFAGQECHDQISAAEDQLIEVSGQARSLRSSIMSGAVSRDDAIKQLQDLHKQRNALLAKIRSTRPCMSPRGRSQRIPSPTCRSCATSSRRCVADHVRQPQVSL